MTTRKNALDQQLDVKGSLNQNSSKNLTDETNFFGQAITGQTGSSISIDSVTSGIVTTSGLTGMSSASIGRFITITNATTLANNGTFLITSFISPTSITYSNSSAISPDANNGSISWTEREPYSLEDNLNFTRTDRANIKGTSFDDDIPTYTRPDDTLTDVSANLTNIASKTLDAHAWVESRFLESISVSTSDSFITVSDLGNLKHADSTNILGIPITDGYDSGNERSAFVEIVDAEIDGYGDGANLRVLNGARTGERIIGLTREGSSTSPNSVEIEFFSIVVGNWSLSSLTPYSWEADQPNTINICYGYRQRLDLFNENATREGLIKGYLSDIYGTGNSGGGSGGGLSEEQHKTLRHLIHFIDDGPGDGFASGAFKEILPQGNPFHTSETWYVSAAKTNKIVELIITRGSGQKPILEIWNIYDTDGSTILASISDAISYTGPFEDSRTRVIS